MVQQDEVLFPPLMSPGPTTAIRFGDLELPYSILATAAAAHRIKLAELGVSPGDCVALWVHPEPETLVALVGNVLAGVVTVPLNPSVGDSELQHILKDASPDLILSHHRDADAVRTPSHRLHDIEMQSVSVTAPRSGSLTDPDDPVLILYTSGTTGAPKGVLLTSRNIATNLDGLTDAWGLTADDTIVHSLPVFHAHGLIFGFFGAMRLGAGFHWVMPFSAERLAAALVGPNRVLYAVPTIYRRLCEAAEGSDEVRAQFSSARLLVSGSAALPAREHARIERLTGQKVVERYGLTETLIVSSIRADGERRPAYVGGALKGGEVRLVDEARQPLTVRDDTTMGEVAVRGDSLFAGYLNRPEATAAVMDDEGWFYTGDLATMTEDGMLRIVGRRSTDLIKTGGFKVGAGEIEGALLEHPSVSEVAVLGVPDEDLGERIVAFVVAVAGESPPTPEALIAHALLHVSKHKRPRTVRLVESLPRNAMGKVQKNKLRELL